MLYSAAFLCLAGKTQVVAASEHGLYHNRLTHTLKVAQLGRRGAELLRRKFLLRHIQDQPDLVHPEVLIPPDPDLVEAACLAHDLGHPPFGHAGEEALAQGIDRELREKINKPSRRQKSSQPPDKEIENAIASLGFEGNAQTFRILTFLAVRKRTGGAERYGLDLTRATLDATIKYPVMRASLEDEKWGAYSSDTKAFEWVRESAPERTRSFEAQLMDWADEVAYAVHDMTDCFRAGFIPLHTLFHPRKPREEASGGETPHEEKSLKDFKMTPEAKRFYEKSLRPSTRERLAKLSDEELRNDWASLENFFVWVEEPYETRTETDALLSRLNGELFEHFMDGISWDGDAPCRYRGRLLIDEDPAVAQLKAVQCAILQELPWHYMIRRRGLITLQHGQRRIVSNLFDAHTDENCEQLFPPDRWEDWNLHKTPLRVAADHIASLTEADAEALFARLSGNRTGAVTDLI